MLATPWHSNRNSQQMMSIYVNMTLKPCVIGKCQL